MYVDISIHINCVRKIHNVVHVANENIDLLKTFAYKYIDLKGEIETK